MIRVLMIMNTSQVRRGGGIVQVILNCANVYANNSDIIIDFAINEKVGCNLSAYLENEKNKFYNLPNKKLNLWRYIKSLYNVLGNRYDCVHVHGNSSTMALELFCAKVRDIPIRIAHCHNMKSDYPVINKLCYPFFYKTYTKAVACSLAAGKWLYKNRDFTIIKNCIDCNKFKYNEGTRKLIRDRLNIDDRTLLLGNIGNFTEQKNQIFLIECLKRIKREIHLLFIGDGEQKIECEQLVKKYGLSNHITFMGLIDNVSQILQALDIFLLPSKWEGLPLVLVEAQCAGLKCLFSKKVSEESIIIPELCRQLELNHIDWIEAINAIKKNERRNECYINVAKKGYDLSNLKKQLELIYEIK